LGGAPTDRGGTIAFVASMQHPFKKRHYDRAMRVRAPFRQRSYVLFPHRKSHADATVYVESNMRDFESWKVRHRRRRRRRRFDDAGRGGASAVAFSDSTRLFKPLRTDVSQFRHVGVIAWSRMR
jgi:hypothetical protein